MNRVLSFLLLFPLLVACNRGYRIEGTSSVNSLDGKRLYLKTMRDGKMVAIDSAEVTHGLFSMSGKTDSVLMATLYMDEESIMPIVIENGKIKVSITDMKANVSGTDLNEALYKFIHERNDLEVSIMELGKKEASMVMDGADYEAVHRKLTAEGDSLMDVMNSYVKTFILDNSANVLGPNVFMMLCSSLPYSIVTPQIDNIIKDAPYEFKMHPLVKEFLAKAKENEKLMEEQKRLQENTAMKK